LPEVWCDLLTKHYIELDENTEKLTPWQFRTKYEPDEPCAILSGKTPLRIACSASAITRVNSSFQNEPYFSAKISATSSSSELEPRPGAAIDGPPPALFVLCERPDNNGVLSRLFP
uniref:Uncharacterized protein n=1 Tax=Parascaris equorum TaxID=6256 RepID=A0A914RUQ7_PAREQ